MNARERWHATMHYLPRDRCPIMDFGFWSETIVIWEQYGLPKGVNTDSFFGMDPQWIFCGGALHLCPGFAEQIIEDRGDTEIFRNGDGVTVERGKFLGSIPRHLDHLLQDRTSWEKHFKPRLVPDDPRRFPPEEEWDSLVAEWTRPDRDYPLFIGGGSLYGVPRNWFGLERISEIVYDDLPLFEEIVETLADIVIYTVEKTCAAGVRPDAASMWEDMCYNAGPLLSPKLFKQVLVPHYKRITNTLKKHGVDIIFLDSDGDITALAPLWLEAGVNTMFPIEVGTWKADPYEFRRRWGKEMRLLGGFDKRVMAESKEAIRREVERLAPLVEEGGFIPMPDHRVPPDVPLENHLFYVEEAKRVWGKGLPNLAPTGVLDPNAPCARADKYAWHLGD
jgi:uroporphyrinogen decarboxylase